MLAARLNYMAQDYPAIQFATKEICRKMACLTDEDFQNIKKLARFMIGMETVKWQYELQHEREALKVEAFAEATGQAVAKAAGPRQVECDGSGRWSKASIISLTEISGSEVCHTSGFQAWFSPGPTIWHAGDGIRQQSLETV